MELFFQLTLAGLAIGSIYACVALAVVMIYQATDHFNFAQGEMAMFSTFIAFTFLTFGAPVWLAAVGAIAISFVAGLIIERVVIKPVENAPILNQIIVFIGMLMILNNMAGWIWEFTIKPFPSLFPNNWGVQSDLIGPHHMGVIGLTLVVLFAIFLFFRFTRVGLAMRAAAANPDSARLVGVSVSWMLALGWGLAAGVGAIGGILVAPIVYLDPNMMSGVLLYAFAGALLGGVSSPFGAVMGGMIVGVLENWIGHPALSDLLGFKMNELKLTFALMVIVIVLLFKPAGLFGRVVVKRV
jgi:branched-chain amino acid transport system permease protein